ncbi:MAG: PTS sugar transporter subunit IIA [Desulfuromonas sp.]|nr:PTS sugar transporter subunit IIA [Desulfuromonas sp.]
MNLSVKDAAQILSVSEKTIYRWIKKNVLPAYKVHESYRFNRAELLEWATSRRMGVAADAFSEPESDGDPLPTLYDALEAGGVAYRIEGKTRNEVLIDAVDHLRLPEEVDREYLTKVLITREQLASTAIGNGIAIPHPRSPGLLNVLRAKVTLCFLEEAIDFHALDGLPVKILFIIIAPNLRVHLHLLSRLSFALHDPDFCQMLNNTECREKIFATLAAAEEKIKIG